MTQTALILGGSGRFGRHMTRAFNDAGWITRQFDRKTDSLMQAGQGADVIVAGWNPPYHHWADQVPQLHAQVRAAALAHGATVMLPGNVYVFGADTPAPWRADTPHRAANPLGRIRREMEEAYRRDGVRTILLRAGDFIDTAQSGNWLDRMMLPSVPRGALTYPGRADIPHAWAFLPDLARAAVMLANQRDRLDRFADIPFPGYTLTGQQMAQVLGLINGRAIRVKPMRWWPLRLAQPLVPFVKHLFEMRYLWDTPHSLDSGTFDRLLPGFTHTPVKQALSQAQVNPDQPVAAGPGRQITV